MTYKSIEEYPGWLNAPAYLEPFLAQHTIRRVADIGGGANPLLDEAFVRRHGLDYAVLDVSAAELAKAPFSSETRTPDPVSITTYVAAQSAGVKLAPSQNHPKEKAAYAAGKEIFFYRAGAFDFSCASCHGVDGQRIRTQPLPNFTKPEQAIRSVQGWPGYRMTGGVMHTLQWRLNDCYRQQRFPEPGYASDTLSALLTYLTVNSNGQVYKGPGIKR